MELLGRVDYSQGLVGQREQTDVGMNWSLAGASKTRHIVPHPQLRELLARLREARDELLRIGSAALSLADGLQRRHMAVRVQAVILNCVNADT